MEDALMAALQWDPHIRGYLIVLTAILILPGSVYLLLATNVGARLGLLLAITGLSGWMMVMGAIWMVYGIGLKGPEPHWSPLELVQAEPTASTVEEMRAFPTGWKKLVQGDKALADASAAADRILAPAASSSGGHGAESGPSAEELAKFGSPFKNVTDYVLVGGYSTGGENYFIPGGALERNRTPLKGWLHKPHHAVVQVQAVKPPTKTGTTTTLSTEPDPTKPVITVVMVRDLGSLRFPPFIVMITTGIIFGICCYTLHQRDKEIWRARAAVAAA